jgi:hypothetical protein
MYISEWLLNKIKEKANIPEGINISVLGYTKINNQFIIFDYLEDGDQAVDFVQINLKTVM